MSRGHAQCTTRDRDIEFGAIEAWASARGVAWTSWTAPAVRGLLRDAVERIVVRGDTLEIETSLANESHRTTASQVLIL